MANPPQFAGKATPTTQVPGGTPVAPFQQITTLSSAQTLTVPTGATWALFTVDAQAVRWRDDGTAPTATVGMLMPVGGLPVALANLSALKFIEVTASAKLNVSYYK